MSPREACNGNIGKSGTGVPRVARTTCTLLHHGLVPTPVLGLPACVRRCHTLANQIATFFRWYPEDEAVTGIRNYIVGFWAPGMRATLLSVARQDEQGLDPLVTKAMLSDPGGKSPITKEVPGSEQVGQLGSNAKCQRTEPRLL